MTTTHSIFGKDRNGRSVNVAFGSGGGAVQAHKAAAARREAAAARRPETMVSSPSSQRTP